MPLTSGHIRHCLHLSGTSLDAALGGGRSAFARIALPALFFGSSLATAAGQTRVEVGAAAVPPAFALAAGDSAGLPVGGSGAAPTSASAGISSSREDSSGGESSLPDAPDAPDTTAQSTRLRSSKRIFGVIPNFRTVSTEERLPAQTVKQKFVTAAQDSFDYSSIFIPAALAGYSLGTNADPEFGGGGLGYARYLWHAAADQTQENFLVEAILPSITHEDARFYTLAHGSAAKRTEYALTRAVITRSDDGREVFNASEVFGSGIAAGLSSLYYPSRERSFGNTSKQWALNVGVDAISFVVKEFAPDISKKFFGTAKDGAQN